MDEKICNERYERLVKEIGVNTKRLNRQSEKIDSLERNYIAIEKDNFRLEEILEELKKAIQNLNDTVTMLKQRPLDRYEKLTWLVVGGLVSLAIGKIFL